MFIKLKLLIAILINLGGFPILAISLFDLGILYAEFASLIWLIILYELIWGTFLLLNIAYKTTNNNNCNEIVSELR